jgi:hypothetical protein
MNTSLRQMFYTGIYLKYKDFRWQGKGNQWSTYPIAFTRDAIKKPSKNNLAKKTDKTSVERYF